MVDKIKTNSRESGMALVFAIGLLAMLLAIGIAFVGNAINSRRAAENNSARTQARMLAMSALSRAASSIMIYAHQFGAANDDELPENFNHIYSYDINGDTESFTDGLFKKEKSDSLMQMPLGGGGLSASEANLFNDPFITSNSGSKWQGNWVFFRDGSQNDKRILGRAAWQVIGSSANILAPVFFRGDLEKVDPADDNFLACDHRWGREIDEVNFIDEVNSIDSDVFKIGDSNMTDSKQSIRTYEEIYKIIDGASTNGELQRWAKRWFFPESNKSGTAEFPTKVKAESYGHGGRSFMRFNISELWQGEYFENPSDALAKYNSWDKAYSVSSNSSDPWYARLGIDTEDSGNVANSETAITRLTTDALLFDGTFDYEIVRNASTDGYSGLPFLRRIGDTQGTFDDLATLRKQIAANFNDYCDADDVPTSDIPAMDWMNAIDSSYKHPAYTGNEKTPYLYELGMILAMVNSAGKNGVDVTLDSTTKKPSFSTSFRALPIVKLANMYPLTASDKEYKADIDFGEVKTEFRIKKVKFPKVKFLYQLADSTVKNFESDIVVDLGTFTDSGSSMLKHLYNNSLVAKIAKDKWVVESGAEAIAEFGAMNNTPYPVAYPVNKWKKPASAADMSVVRSDGADFGAITIGDNILSLAGVELAVKPDDFVASGDGATPVTSVTFDKMEVQSIEVVKVTVVPRRAVLSKKVDSTDTGMDYAKFEKVVGGVAENKSFEWSDFINPVTGGVQNNLEFTFADTLDGIVLGGIRTEDPRQNLNSSDWDIDSEARAVFASDLADAAKTDYNSDIAKVMDINSDGSGKANTFIRTDKKVSPKNPVTVASDPDDAMDWETVTEPAYKGASDHISTAIIRNAPMMSPWEIGFIHRGVKWQTLNIKNTHKPSGIFADNKAEWNKAGTSYSNGDGAIFDQIKMFDQSYTYGKINVNMLNSKYSEYRAKEDQAIVQALFQGIRYGEDPWIFIQNSTREGDGKFPDQENSGTVINANAAKSIAEEFFKDGNRSTKYSSRSEFLNYTGADPNDHWCLERGFSTTIAGQQNTDASQEEIIGKTINLLCAEKSTPTVVDVIIVAQSIKDVEGTIVRQVNAKSSDDYKSGSVDDDGIATKNCSIGTFDMYEHEKNDDKNVYFDEITGEVKMRATLRFDNDTRRLYIDKVDYL